VVAAGLSGWVVEEGNGSSDRRERRCPTTVRWRGGVAQLRCDGTAPGGTTHGARQGDEVA
jgi:hypothetical protein